MRITLEWPDVIRILSEHLGRELDDGSVTVRTEPFEIEVRGISGVEDLQKQPSPALAYPTGARATREPDEEAVVTDQPTRPRGAGTDIFTTLQQAKEIERELNRLRPTR